MRLYLHPVLTATAIALVSCVGFVSSVIDSFSPPMVRAHEAMESGNFEKAGKELSFIISSEPDNYTALMMRAECYRNEETYNAALEDIAAAEKIVTKLDNKDEDKESILQGITNLKAMIYTDMKKYSEVVKVYIARLKIVKNQNMKDELNNNIAWYLSTSPGSTKENGISAIKYAQDACKSSEYQHPGQLDTLAASYARAGNMQAAIKWQREVIKIMKENEEDDEEIEEMMARLRLYINGKAYTEE
jgi:tetratricopeptide (TPR) repeat protein